MSIRLLSPYPAGIIDVLTDEGNVVIVVEQPQDLAAARERDTK